MNLKATFQDMFGHSPTIYAHAPGRVNLLGEHVDYNEGPVLPAAIDRYVNLAAHPRKDRIVRIYSIDLGEEVSFDLTELDQKKDTEQRPLPSWALYPAGVAWAFQDASLFVQSVEVVFTSNVPIGAGLSSSAALEVCFAVLWEALGNWQLERVKLALLCQKAENQYVGVACGLMDQFASACGVEGHALYFDTRSLEWYPAPLPPGTAIVIADSGIRRNLSNSEYNERRRSCERAVTLLRQYLPGIRSLRDVPTTEFAAYSYFLPDLERKRAEHVVKEIARVGSALSALKRQDKQAFGALMYASHTSLRNFYEVSTPELDLLVDLARKQPGIIGARLTGAGFGGCTVNLVEAQHAQAFIDGLKTGYEQATGRETQVYLCKASQGAGSNRV